ncbi:MAG TPA: hypothetical protein VNO52_02965, partial [Methylomirabilota bacterium]|nr:hypothetical protein [Methylomirabilota bacterium]
RRAGGGVLRVSGEPASPAPLPQYRPDAPAGAGDHDRAGARDRFWRRLVAPLLDRVPTPFYLFSLVPIRAALAELEAAFGARPVRHWLSCKTQPLRPLLRWWCAAGRGIEVVSEFELKAALAEGFPPERILVNGPAKHVWLSRYPLRGLRVNFDSAAEVRALLPLARRCQWCVGLRILTGIERDPEYPNAPTQFGLDADEALAVIRRLQRPGLRLEAVHFHLRTNVPSSHFYERALHEVAGLCRAAHFAPRFVDCGGGFPPPHVRTRGDRRLDAEFDLADMARVADRAARLFPGMEELWLENGRWLTARSGALVVRVLDAKERRGQRHLICDGGKTLNALVATWEKHDLLVLPRRRGPEVMTTVSGPTCMAFDQLARQPLPRALRPGDHVVWLDAGAYHLPWETRFSHGRAAICWHDGGETALVRAREGFDRWWDWA